MRRRRGRVEGGDYKEKEEEVEEKLEEARGMLRVHGKHGEGLEWRGKERRKRRREKET